ncbi:response regulator transcription factor [uncultured Microbacterium sp.]|uniref:response regulator transcription factor n=1 Tax=uncultured Microbacterium sp. TaxID=191216 RepID=UPI00262EBCA3|nr:response regulator transcription factor [uncultured Microbacterium sp.]
MNTTHETAVVIDDDNDVRSLLAEILRSAGFDVIEADNGIDGIAAVLAHNPAITTLDVNMPGIDGFETARRIRAGNSGTYIVLITALTDEADSVLGFSVGADDVVVKPFRARELRARLLAAQRRTVLPNGGETATPPSQSTAPATGWNGLHIDRQTRTATVDGQPIVLTRTEFDLLATIIETEREVRTKADLVRVAHAVPDMRVSVADERAIETHITNLRRKLGESAAEPRFIETVRGVGYRAIIEPLTPESLQ